MPLLLRPEPTTARNSPLSATHTVVTGIQWVLVARRPWMRGPVEHLENLFRFVAIVQAPWLNRASQDMAEWGFHCVDSVNLTGPTMNYRRKYNAESFDEHMEQYGVIQGGKHCLNRR
ncbi:hypothetical protein B0T10DRAFT_467597 [Thelonectria olida]|uniref:Uncharacterized protein n=1 Tax=Thelonectria olida TaxID=1576542 RepID=A0A9P8VNU9_9HYPO|nr:hypothetical protein B0T10DRAFT_467597 [Thelonectria olida]